MKTILLIPEYSSSGGTRTYFKFLLAFYHGLGYKIILAVNKDQIDEEIKELIKRYLLKCVFLPKRINGYRNIFLRFPFYLLWDISVILYAMHKYSFEYIVCSIGTPGNMLGAFLFPKKVIYILHTYPMCKLPKIVQQMVYMRLSNDRKIINVSKFTCKQVCRFWLGVEENQFVKHVYSFSAENPNSLDKVKNRDAITVLTLGHVREYKNPRLWIEVAREINEIILEKKIKFIWAGDGELLEECKNFSSHFGDNIQFIGYKKNVAELYELADIYFQPSKIENLSISILDAMNYGIPCIVSNVGGSPELVIDGENGFVIDINDKQMIIEKMLFLINNEEKRYMMGKRSKERYNNCFSKEKWRKEMLDILK